MSIAQHDVAVGSAEKRPDPPVPVGVVRPELLSPAGDWECARAAVENGADAIYFGLDVFNARMRAKNFTRGDLPSLMEFLHGRGVRGYLSFNTLVFPGELAEAEKVLREVIAAGVDAAIVQDVGICRLIRRISPDFPIHASTQMTITSAAGVEFARELGCNLVVLAREVPIPEIERIQVVLRQGAGETSPVPLEVFVHGALCVAYSGQCLTSESLGGRSANRGVCAQACRLPYALIADGEPVALGDRRYLLSPQDLAGVEVLPELMRAGVASLKIEGRLKAPEYVANITRIYREAIDRIGASMAGAVIDEAEPARVARELRDASRYAQEMSFSRGLYTGWLRGVNNQALVHGRFGKKRGVYLGEVTRVIVPRVFVALEGTLKPGDGVVFDAGRPDLAEEGGRVYGIEPSRSGPGRQEVALSFGQGEIQFERIKPGDKLWKTDDPELNRRLRASYAGDVPRYQRPVRAQVQGKSGEPMVLVVRDEAGVEVQVQSAIALVPAIRRPLTEATLRQQLGRLGGTPFRLGTLENGLEGEVLLPMSELNRMRREVVGLLEARSREVVRWTIVAAVAGTQEDGAVPRKPRRSSESSGRADASAKQATRGPGNGRNEPELIVLVRTTEQLEVALELEVRTVYCEFEDPKRYREAVGQFRARHSSGDGAEGSAAIYVAPPRVFKMGEEWILKQVKSCGADGYLVRNHDQLSFFAGERRVGDYSLNVANRLAAEYFMNRWGLERVTASSDLNHVELEALLESATPDWFEIILHQHMPMFHMEHCVFCAFLSKGTDYTNCGRPCDRHELQLRDRVGAEHPVKADAGCRNTVYNAAAQTGAEHLRRFLACGARRFRVEFLNESAEQVTRTVTRYREVLAGRCEGSALWRELKLINHLGVTRGPMG
jgi:U32 family peptidase